VPWGILIGGEELHNNHHAYPTSAKLSYKRYEFDIGWLYIRVLETLGVARVKHVAPIPHFTAPRPAVDPQTLQAVITNRYDVLAQYAQSLKRAFAEETGKLWKTSPADARALETVEPWLDRDEKMLHEPERTRIAEVLRSRGRCTRCMRCAASWRRCGDARRPRASSSSSSSRTGAGGPRQAASGR